MDVIERLFGLSPDGGSGSFEFMLLVLPIVAIVGLVAWRRARQRRLPPG